MLHCYDWVCIPLVYTHVAALATYGYFAFCLIGRQFIEAHPGQQNATLDKMSQIPVSVDYYIPILSILEFLFYIGWFKVGQDLIRPFGGDDDDFELNYILERNLHASKFLVNNLSSELALDDSPPEWNCCVSDKELPHAAISSELKNRPPKMHIHLLPKQRYKVGREEEAATNLKLLEACEADLAKWRYF